MPADRPSSKKKTAESPVALSIRQPWATLVVHGIKTIEIRSWSSKRTGPIYIHAGREPDRRDDAWRFVPKSLMEFTELRGGIVGRANLIECIRYEEVDHFARDVRKHFNNPDWFTPPRLFGLVMSNAKACRFTPCKGDLYFFPFESKLKTGRE